MSKITISGNLGVKGYAADGTTIEKELSVSGLNQIKPTIFPNSAQPIKVVGGVQFDGIPTPPYLRFKDGTDELLDAQGLLFVTKNMVSYSEGTTSHISPGSIQSGDLLIMMQANEMYSGAGYGPSRNYGTGFTNAGPTTQHFNYESNNYRVLNHDISYRVADGTEGSYFYNFNMPSEANGNGWGRRVMLVFRPTYSHNGNVSVTYDFDRVTSGSQYTTSHSLSATVTPSSTDYSCVVGLYTSGQHPYNVNITYSDPSAATFYTQAYSQGSGLYQMIQARWGYVDLIQPGNSAVTLSGPTTTDTDGLTLVCFTLT